MISPINTVTTISKIAHHLPNQGTRNSYKQLSMCKMELKSMWSIKSWTSLPPLELSVAKSWKTNALSYFSASSSEAACQPEFKAEKYTITKLNLIQKARTTAKYLCKPSCSNNVF